LVGEFVEVCAEVGAVTASRAPKRPRTIRMGRTATKNLDLRLNIV